MNAPGAAKSAAPVLSDQEKIAWLRLIRTENVGPITFYRLIERYGTAAKALEALPELARRGGRMRPAAAPPLSAMEREMESVSKLGAELVFAGQADYPISLSALEDAPPVLTVLGNKKLLRRPGLAVVGARNASLNGRKLAEKMARELGEAGQIIVSGLARGIDAAAHEGALDTGTIAAVAGGIDVIYPPENEKLYGRIREQGLIVAESPVGMEPLARHFPRRNRIISGLSSGVLVVEATLKSGSLITARMALEQGRDVYAIPGHPFDPRAAGPNQLIRDGAILVQRAQDLIENIDSFASGGPSLHEPSAPLLRPAAAPQTAAADNPIEARELVLQNLSAAPVAVDELIRTCQLTIPVLQTVLLELELAGRLQRLPGGRVVMIS